MALSPPHAVGTATPEGEVVTVLAPGEAHLPRRRNATGPAAVERFVAILGSLVDRDTTVAKLNFTKALEARSPVTLRAMACSAHPVLRLARWSAMQ